MDKSKTVKFEPTIDEIDETYDEIVDKDNLVAIGEIYYGKIINIFHIYYKKLFNEKENVTLFEGIKDLDKETNREMELFYEMMEEFELHANDDDYQTIYKPEFYDMNDKAYRGELYALHIDGHMEFVCRLLMPLIKYVARLEWNVINWNIFRIKSEEDIDEDEDEENNNKDFIDQTIKKINNLKEK